MNCPKCNYPQQCPCKNCNPSVKPWIQHGDVIECAGCGFKAHSDWWERKALEELE
jgi:hypothetical protein